ncbi:MAG: RadC family protein [Chloroflexota bacterium]|nr:DNA repair protein RadC [Dehalococcoidales bacterium]
MAIVEYHPTIKDLPMSERPRERLLAQGPDRLANHELLAILLRTGLQNENAVAVAQRLLARFDGLAGLARASQGELCAERGLGEAKAAQLLAAIELGRRLASAQPEERVQVRSPADVANLLSEMAGFEQEHLKIVLLNAKNQVVAIRELYKGAADRATIRVGEVFREAVRQNSVALVVAHNHPSGDPNPSPEDVRVTGEIVEAGRLLDIEVLDHLVIGRGRFVSLRERRLGFQ